MLFDTFQYWVFFFTVVGGFYSMPYRYGKLLLLVASYTFYMWWDVRFIVLILASTLVDYALGILLDKAEGPWRKKLLWVSLIVNLGLLGFFKYYNFFAESLVSLLGLHEHALALRIILPVGISFYTFASLSYTIDVYFRKIRAVRNLIDYAFFIAFFPHLIAGPIIRAKRFLPQVNDWRRPSSGMVQMGITLILCGLIKKTVFADRFAVASDAYFADVPGHPGWLTAWSAAFLFSLQLFFDFSGYTDIARGCAKLLGFEFPLNFRRPYLATNVFQFWQRWHITLSSWMRDYVFLPMVGRSRSQVRLSLGLTITMVVVGLWHEASWTFVLWGLFIAVVLIGYRVLLRAIGKGTAARALDQQALVPLNVLLTFICFNLSMAFFRPKTLRDAFSMLRTMTNFHGFAGPAIFGPTVVVMFMLSFLVAVLEERHHVIERLAVARPHIQIPFYVVAVLSLELFAVTGDTTPFLYFQF